jgi:hypothetical protein
MECRNAAAHVNVIVHTGNAKHLTKLSEKRLLKIKEEYRSLFKHGRGFIRHSQKIMKDLRQKADRLHSAPASDHDLTNEYQRWRTEHLALIANIEAATGEVETVLKNCKPPTAWKPRDPMKWIADAATGAWERLGGKPPALGKYSVSPLVEFVRLAMQGIGFTGKDGQPYSDETISDHLNERIGGGGARRRHSGAKRSTKHP